MVNFGWYFDINQDKIDLEDVVRNGQTGPNNLSSLSPSATLNTYFFAFLAKGMVQVLPKDG